MSSQSKELFTFLAKINSAAGSGYWGELFIEDHKQQKFKTWRGNLSDERLKQWKGKWRFFTFEYKSDQLYYVKSIICDRMISELMIEQYRAEKGKKSVEAKENINSVDSCTERSGAGMIDSQQ